MKAQILALLSTLALAPVAAAATPVNDAPADADPWFDITVLTAQVRTDLTLKTFDHVENCDKVQDEWQDGGVDVGQLHYEAFDCTAYVARQLNATVFKKLPLWTFTNGQLTSAYQLATPLVEIHTVVPIDRMARADYLGFSESWLGGAVDLFRANGPAGQTHEIAKVKLKDGRTGVVHRWFAAFEENGQDGSYVLRALPFKPVLVRSEDGAQVRYWDRLIGTGFGSDYVFQNFVVNASGGYDYVTPRTYDRSSELLQ